VPDTGTLITIKARRSTSRSASGLLQRAAAIWIGPNPADM
jgi:hypothetical protein